MSDVKKTAVPQFSDESDYATIAEVNDRLNDARIYTDMSAAGKLDSAVFDNYINTASYKEADIEARIGSIEYTIDSMREMIRGEIIDKLISEIAGKFKNFVSSMDFESMSDDEFNRELEKLLYEKD